MPQTYIGTVHDLGSFLILMKLQQVCGLDHAVLCLQEYGFVRLIVYHLVYHLGRLPFP